MRSPAALLALCLSLAGQAQVDSSLTREFAGMSAKERSRLAKKEQDDARADTRFNEVMTEADALFQAQRYDDALAKYVEARKLRPLNVYPKVKIQDLQALLAKRKAEQAAAEPPTAEPVAAPVETLAEPPATQAVQAPVPETRHVPPPEQAPLPRTEELPAPAKEERTVPEKTEPPAPPEVKAVDPPKHEAPVVIHRSPEAPEPVVLEDGLTERSFIEGRAVVLEFTVVREGVATVYRKVTHPWGQVIHFRDGQAISEREWVEAFPGR